MRLPIDTTGLMFLLVRDAEPVRDFETKQVKADSDGVPLFQVELVAMGNGEADIIRVKVAGEPEGLTVNGPVTVTGLVAQPWQMDGGRSGVSFRADGIRDGAPTGKARASASSGSNGSGS
jgi:hypothetical protein